MIEFTLNRNKNGKKSRWAKKYPRKRILKRGSEKAAGWYFHNWYDDGYHYFRGDLHKFLLKNVGRPVDKVFSEFLKRCRKGTEKYNLKNRFYEMFKNKEDINYEGGFYLTNGIINYRKRSKKPDTPFIISPNEYSQFNVQNFPSKNKIYDICKEAERTHEKQLIGTFYVKTGPYKFKKSRVYVVAKLDYKEYYFFMRIANIESIGIGVNFLTHIEQRKLNNILSRYVSWYEYYLLYNKELPDYIFLAKE